MQNKIKTPCIKSMKDRGSEFLTETTSHQPGSYTAKQWRNNQVKTVIVWINKSAENDPDVLRGLCKAIRHYLLTLQVSRYCLLTLQRRAPAWSGRLGAELRLVFRQVSHCWSVAASDKKMEIYNWWHHQIILFIFNTQFIKSILIYSECYKIQYHSQLGNMSIIFAAL